jgi:hypothetical protein
VNYNKKKTCHHNLLITKMTYSIGNPGPRLEINVREFRRGNQKWTIQRNWQHRVHKTKKTKQKHNTICVGNHYMQINTNNVNKT